MRKLLRWLCFIYGDASSLQAIREGNREPETFADLWFVFRNHFQGLTLYNPLGLLAGIVFTACIFKPWWYAALHMDYFTIRAYPFILRHDLPSDSLDYVIETPLVGVAFLLWLLLSYLFLAFWGSTLPGKKGRLFLIACGIFMLLYTAGFYIALWYATHRVHLPVTGYSSVPATVQVDIHMHFLSPYFIAIGAGVVCLLSALIHGLAKIRLGRRSDVSS
jgi:hypothetical protein